MYGFESGWRWLEMDLKRWLKELAEERTPVFASLADPFEALAWLEAREREHRPAVDAAVARMALAPREPIPLPACEAGWPRYLLRERLRMAADLAEALGTPCREAERPCSLFPRAMHEGAEEQLVLWSLRGYWREKGCQRWLLHQLHCLLYAARTNGWKQE
jgi:hypothetical protein